MKFDRFPDNSRVWIYTSQTPLGTISDTLQNDLDSFVAGWASHGNELYGAADILHDRFIVLCVDESRMAASGCSIDTSTRFMKSLEEKYGLNLFDRLHLIIEKSGEQRSVHFSKLSDYPDWYLYNPAVTTLAQLKERWKIPVTESSLI